MKLLIKADDYGFTEAINYGIIKGHKDGIVTSTALMANMPGAAHGIELIKDYPLLCLGIHINLVVGKPVSDPRKVQSLLQADGSFISSKTHRQKIAGGVEPIPNIEEGMQEVEAQLLRFYELTGRMPEYLEGHAISSKNLTQIYHAVAKKYDLVHVSHKPELSHRISCYPTRAKSIYEWYPQGKSPELYFTENACDILDKDTALVVTHPGYVDRSITEMSSYTAVRANDLYALTHPATLQWVKDNNIELISFRALKAHIA